MSGARLVSNGNDEPELNDSDFVGAEIESPKQNPMQRVFGDFGLYRQAEQEQKTVGYLEGLKGVFAFEAFLWLFLRCIVPGATFEGLTENGSAPRYESVLREVFSPLFWDGHLQASAFVILATRIVCIRFLTNKDSMSMAGTLFRRGLRLFVPVIVAMALVKITQSAGAFTFIPMLREATGNNVPEEPYALPGALGWWNATFNLFWFIDGVQAGVKAFPGGMMWIVSVVYQQSYTVYMIALVLPYMTKNWRLWGPIAFAFVSWWLTSWAWYGTTGLVFAELAINHDLQARAKKGFSLPKTTRRLPYWVLPGLSLAVGIILKYVYEDAEPTKINNELIFHSPIYGGGLNRDYDINQPQQRASSWFLMVGILLIVEASPVAQKIMGNPLFRYLGRLSFGWFLTMSILMYGAGIQLFLRFLTIDHFARPIAQLIVFLVMLPVTLLCADLFTRLVDNPSKWLANALFDWFRKP